MSDETKTLFEERVQTALGGLPPAEQRIARFFVDRKEVALLSSAAQIAERAGASDATVVRTARSLGFDGLSELREALLADLTGASTPHKRLQATIAETEGGPAGALRHVLALHEEMLGALRGEVFADSLTRGVEILAAGRKRHIFGIGPSGALAEYAALQFSRVGYRSHALSTTGIGLADQLLRIETQDAILMIAYAPLYREASVVLDEAERLGVPVVLVSDSLGAAAGDRVAEALPVPRGRADHLAMHGGTMVLIEALIVGMAASDPDKAFESLDRFSGLRGALDKHWSKRGARGNRR